MMIVLLLLTASVVSSEFVDYSGYQVWRLNPTNDAQLEFLGQLAENDLELDFWQAPRALGFPVDVMVPPMRQTQLHYDFAEQGLIRDIYMADVGSHNRQMQEEMEARRAERRARDLRVFSFDDYNTYQDIVSELNLLVGECPPESMTCEVEYLGTSFEGRLIEAFKITEGNEGFHDQNVIIIDSGIHAREWLSIATNLKLVQKLIYEDDVETQTALAGFEWYIIPMVNPDGYVETWVGDRYWRKNRHRYGDCSSNNGWGVDLNRNFPFHFDEGGASDQVCQQTYHGPSAASEVETQVIMAETAAEQRYMSAYISMHTYGYYWLCPYAYEIGGSQCATSPDEAIQVAACNVIADAIQSTYNENFWSRGPVCSTISPGSGDTLDSTYGINGVVYSFGPELRGDPYGFAPPPSFIQPSFNELWSGLLAMTDFIRQNPPPARK